VQASRLHHERGTDGQELYARPTVLETPSATVTLEMQQVYPNSRARASA